MAQEAIYLQVLGPLRVWRGTDEVDPGPLQQRTVLALLLARGGHPIGMTELIELLWGHRSPASAVNVIHKYVSALRRLLQPDLPPRSPGDHLRRHGNGYRFAAGPDTLDLVRFRALVTEARAGVVRGELDGALDRYTEALRLGHGPAGDGLTGTVAAQAWFAGLDAEFADVVVAASGIAVRLRKPARLLTPLRRAAERDPLNESVQASLVTTLAAAGHQAEALAAYRSVCARLADELGIDPGRDLREAQRRVLTQTALPPCDGAVLPVGGGAFPPGDGTALTPDSLPPGGAAFPLGDGTALTPASLPASSAAALPPGGGAAVGLLLRPAQLPPEPPLFAGRDQELAALDRLAANLRNARNGPLVIALDGSAGAGKSTLAVTFAHRVTGDFPDGQLYLDLRGDQRDTLLSVLFALGVPASNMPGTVDAQLGAYRTLTAGRRLLVLLDNVRDAAQVRSLLPNSGGCLVLLTSRQPLLEVAARDGAHLMRIGLPDHRSARELLELRLPARPSPSSVEKMVEACGHQPMALALAAARLKYPSTVDG